LMVNYDLPWNPNRIEHASRIQHRSDRGMPSLEPSGRRNREETFIASSWTNWSKPVNLWGQVFDVLGKFQFEGNSYGSLIEAIRYAINRKCKPASQRGGARARPRPFSGTAQDHASPTTPWTQPCPTLREDMERQRPPPSATLYRVLFLEAFSYLEGRPGSVSHAAMR
jgi:hypothetical protein